MRIIIELNYKRIQIFAITLNPLPTSVISNFLEVYEKNYKKNLGRVEKFRHAYSCICFFFASYGAVSCYFCTHWHRDVALAFLPAEKSYGELLGFT